MVFNFTLTLGVTVVIMPISDRSAKCSSWGMSLAAPVLLYRVHATLSNESTAINRLLPPQNAEGCFHFSPFLVKAKILWSLFSQQKQVIIQVFPKRKWHKTNFQKSENTYIYINHLHYSNNEQSEREIKITIPSITAFKRIKYLGINLTEEVKDLHTEKS